MITDHRKSKATDKGDLLNTNSEHPMEDQRQELQWRWFILGVFFLLVAVGFAGWAFYEECLSQDRLRILQWALPIASGFMAWTFTGTMTTRGRSFGAGLVVFATGGFAIWLITTYVLIPTITSDPKCEPLACSKVRPCVDIDRIADFTSSKCLPNGEKFDLVRIDDTYSIEPAQDRYMARANRMVMPNQQVRVFDLNSSDTIPLPFVEGGSPSPDSEHQMYSVKFLDGKARIRYEWRNAYHGENIEGLAFLSNYRIRNIKAKTLLPPNVSIKPESIKFAIPDQAKKICDHATMECKGLYTDIEVQLHWEWNMWDGCRDTPAATS